MCILYMGLLFWSIMVLWNRVHWYVKRPSAGPFQWIDSILSGACLICAHLERWIQGVHIKSSMEDIIFCQKHVSMSIS